MPERANSAPEVSPWLSMSSTAPAMASRLPLARPTTARPMWPMLE